MTNKCLMGQIRNIILLSMKILFSLKNISSSLAFIVMKANQNFLELQAQLEGTENRISTERRAYNEAVQQFNTTVRSFPNNLMAGMFGFKAKGTFTAQEGADKAPAVSF